MKPILARSLVGLAILAAQLICRAAEAPDAALPSSAAVPAWPKPAAPQLSADAPAIRSQTLELRHGRGALGQFVVSVEGKPMAIGQDRPLIGYVAGGELRWVDIGQGASNSFVLHPGPRSIQAVAECADADGGRWEIEQQFSPGRLPGTLEVRVRVKVDRDRAIAFLPMFMIFPGAGSFGSIKGQGLFAGLEYLENEPSSSEADVVGPASKRQVPDVLKITFPLMAIQSEGRYVALSWEMQPQFSALFDSPDRLFGSGGHVMGVVFPGSDGRNREEGALLPRASRLLAANQPLELRATLLGGAGKSVVPAVEQYVALRGLPELRDPAVDLQKYVALAAHGWLDSKIRAGNLVRHAIFGDVFKPGPAADAALWMDWLAAHTPDPALAARLTETARSCRAPVSPESYNAAAVGHVRYPVEALLYGHVAENVASARQHGRQLLTRFGPDGAVRYAAQPGGVDYGKTHFTNEASGFTAQIVLELLQTAAVSGDRELLDAALKRLRAMGKFHDAIPRGAQTWECPLHIPDILASAHMVHAYALGYELSGEPEFLEQARYWAWTGVPFVYLTNPTDRPVGLYATIAVFGATNWKAPVWLGLPVQWCGLVYADALYCLNRLDPKGPWKKIADGITLSGIQQSWPTTDEAQQGLLPDSFVLRDQQRSGPAINPATVQACAVQYFSQTAYGFRAFRQNSLRLHAPGDIKHAKESAGRVSFEVELWPKQPCYLLLNGLTRKPALKLDGKTVACEAPHQFLEQDGLLILQVQGKAKIELSF